MARSNAWYDDTKGHSRAAKKAWRTRKRRYPPTGYSAKKARKTTRRSAKRTSKKSSRRRRSNAWYDDSAGHAAAARKGWKTRRRRRNPSSANPVNLSVSGIWSFTKSTFTLNTVGGGVVGAVATIAVPKIFHLNDGSWKEILSSVAVVGVGGYLIAEFVDEQAGYAFAVTGAAVVGMKLLRIGLAHTAFGKKAASYLGGTQEETVEGSIDEFMGLADFDIGEEDTSDEYELFGLGQDEEDEALDELFGEEDGALVPTFSGVA